MRLVRRSALNLHVVPAVFASSYSLSMTSTSSMAHAGLRKYACSLCARRKVKCDKVEPCSNCVKAQAQCLYEASAPYRPRKRAADEDLLIRLARYEDLMRKHNVDFAQYANTWVSSEIEANAKETDSQSAVSVKYPSDSDNSRTHNPDTIAIEMQR